MNVTLTRFMDFVNANGLYRRRVVNDYINSDDYSPCKDYYREMRDAIISMYKNGESLDSLDDKFALIDEKKQTNYPALLSGYKKWAKRKKIVFLETNSYVYDLNGLKLSINPELVLKIDGKPTVVKLYFKKDKLKKDAADIVSVLIAMTFCSFDNKYSDYDFGVMDLRNSKFLRITQTTQVDEIKNTLEVDAMTWLHYQEQIQRASGLPL